jgi:sec-independent protein translocase protein TatC
MPFPIKGPKKEPRRQFTGDPEDYRLSLVEHLEELRDRIIRSVYIICVTWTIGWFAEPQLYTYLDVLMVKAVTAVIPKGSEFKEIFTHAPDAFMLKLKLSFMIGLILAFPFLVLQLWAFIMPALKPKEQAPLKKLAPASVILFATGVGFAWEILPSAVRWFASYIEEFPGTSLYQEAGSMVFFVLKMLAAFGVAFQLPLVVYILGELELLTAETLIKYWRQSATAIFIIAMIVTPSQDPMTMLMMAVPLVILFMGSVYVVRFSQRRKKKRAKLTNPDETESDTYPLD